MRTGVVERITRTAALPRRTTLANALARAITVAVMLATALACSRKPADDAYFPLAPGRSWTYTMTPEGGGEPLTLTATIAGPEDMAGTKVTRERIEVDGRTQFLFVGVDERGIYRHATQAADAQAPTVEAERDYFLMLPLDVGHSWQGKTSPTFLEVADMPVPIVSKIESTSETIRTPAGEFKDCVKIHVTGGAEVRNEFLEDDAAGGDAAKDDDEDWDPVGGTFTVDEQTWYAKDVGLVRSIVTETFKGKSGNDDRAQVTTELQAFTR
jgi:hypothetical protein